MSKSNQISKKEQILHQHSHPTDKGISLSGNFFTVFSTEDNYENMLYHLDSDFPEVLWNASHVIKKKKPLSR